MAFNCLKARATSRRQFTSRRLFITKFSEISGTQDERLSRLRSHPVVLNTGHLHWESSVFWMEMVSLHRNIQLMLELLNAPFLGLHPSYYTLMTFLTMSFVNLPSMLIILLSTLSVIRHLIYGNN